MIYPEAHPKHAEISELKKQIDEKYRLVDTLQIASRENYKAGLEQFRQMGESMRQTDEALKELSKFMNDLEVLITSPLI